MSAFTAISTSPRAKIPGSKPSRLQDSAAPYHDWNERITAECYATNGAARIVNNKNQIIRIVNNYSRMSFNFGPTLLSWLEGKCAPHLRMILDADQRSQKHFYGHGSAMAQVYNHMIMPLANHARQDHANSLGHCRLRAAASARMPEGMWLSETAVDTESLELLAQHGIQFTILAPHQCARIRLARPRSASRRSRKPPPPPKTDAAGELALDTKLPMPPSIPRCPISCAQDGRSIAVFFYDGPLARHRL